MSYLQVKDLLNAKQWDWNVLDNSQYWNQSSLLLLDLGAYIDIGDDAVINFDLSLQTSASSLEVRCKVGCIVAVAKQHKSISSSIELVGGRYF